MSELTKALCKFHADVATIHKAATAQYGKFADLATVLSAVTPPLAKNGLVITQIFQPGAEGSEPLLITTLRHVSGETVESVLPLVVNNGRNKLHDLGASVTYLRRYALLSLVGLCADVDTDGAFVEDEPKAKPAAAKAEEPKAKAKPKAKPVEKAVGNVENTPISKDDRDMVMALLRERHSQNATQIKELSKAFNDAFPDTADSPLSQSIHTQAHVDFINSFLTNAPA